MMGRRISSQQVCQQTLWLLACRAAVRELSVSCFTLAGGEQVRSAEECAALAFGCVAAPHAGRLPLPCAGARDAG